MAEHRTNGLVPAQTPEGEQSSVPVVDRNPGCDGIRSSAGDRRHQSVEVAEDRRRGPADRRDVLQTDSVRMYLDDIGRHRVLLKAEEAELGRLMERGKVAQVEYDREERPTPGRRRHLLRVIREGEEARDRLIEANLRLVVTIAKQYRNLGVDFLDLIQEGNIGLIQAVGNYDWRKEAPLVSYAKMFIRQAIERGAFRQAKTIRMPVTILEDYSAVNAARSRLLPRLGREPLPRELAAESNLSVQRVVVVQSLPADPLSLSDSVGGDSSALVLGDRVADVGLSLDDQVARRFLMRELEQVLAPLTDLERKVLFLRIGVDRGQIRSMREVAAVLGMPAERARQVEARSVAKLRHPRQAVRRRRAVSE